MGERGRYVLLTGQGAVHFHGKDKVKNETGLTFSAGFIFKVNDHFDIALIAGQDRVFGEAREQFEHQGDWWFSFGIGYKFTK